MPVFGQYETVRELYRSGLASASTARKVGGDGAEQFVVKHYQPFSLDGEDRRVQEQLETFLDGARTQREVASSGAEHWAAVHEVGTAEGSAYFVTDYHPRSLQRLIRGRVKLDGKGLYGIIRSVVQGLVELRAACHRPHGNLKPSNILLSGGKDVSRAKVLLTDPAGAGQLDPQTGDVGDFHAVGELIYQLVLHRTGRAMGGWPAPESEEWNRLGRNGPQWRQLCNRLLNPNLAPGLLTFQDLGDDLDKLRETGGAAKKVVLPVAAGVLLLAAAAGAYVVLSGPRGDGKPKPFFVAEDWQRLCAQFGDWVEPLLSDREVGRLRAWQGDAYLKQQVLPLLDQVVTKANPRKIAGQSWGDVYKLGENPTPAAQTEQAVRRTRQALDVIDLLQGSLCSEEWPALARTARAEKQYAARGWAPAAGHLRSLLPFQSRHVVQRVGAILAVQDSLARIEARWQELQALQKVIEGSPFKSLEPIGQYILSQTQSVRAEGGPQALDALRDRLDELAAASGPLRRLAAYIQSGAARRLDPVLVQSKPPFPVPPDGTLTEEVLRSGLATLTSGKYDAKADPRTPEWRAKAADSLAARHADIQSLAGNVGKLLKDTKLQDQDRRDLQGVLGSVQTYQQTVGGLRQTLTRVNGFAVYNYGSREAIDTGMEQLDAGLNGLIAQVGTTSRRFEKIRTRLLRTAAASLEEFRAALTSRTRIAATGLAEIDQAWLAQRNVLLQGETTVEALSGKVERLESFLRDLESRFEPGLGAKVPQRPWSRSLLSDELPSRRRHAVASCLSFASWQKVFAAQQDQTFLDSRDALVKAYNDWRAGVAKIVPAFYQIEDALAAGYLLSEQPAGLNVSLERLYADQQQSGVFKDGAVQAALQPIVARLEQLKQAVGLSDPQRLVALAGAAGQGQLAGARAAWLRLGRTGRLWPGSPAELGQELEVRKNLSAVYGLLPDAGRKAALNDELAAEGRRRWEAYFVSRSDPKEIDGAIARMADYGVDRGAAALSPLARFRLHMHDFQRAVSAPAGSLADEDVKKAAVAFQTAVQALPAAFAQRPAVASLIRQLDEVQAATGGGVDPTKAGPAQAGWKADEPAGGTVTYSWSGSDQKLTFARVSAAGGQDVFVSTTEVSVGLFLSVVLGGQKWDEMARLLREYDPSVEDPREGPRVWVLEAGRIALSRSWLFDTPALGGVHYPAGRKPPDPDRHHPMQHVSLPAAVYFAALIGCRLPTSGEWAAAYEADQKVKSAGLYNLRDKTWGAQRQFAIQQEGQGKAGPEFYPDAGIFWPKGTAYESRKAGRDASIVEQDDGVLWFARVSSDSQRVFQHLVGNVAEFVYDDPKALAELKVPTADGVQQLLRTAAAARVIGGSALSAPEVPRDKALEMTAAVAAEGASDMGFRLAFLAGRERLHSRVLRLLAEMANQGYLPAETPKAD
jgi:hypothetical protein